MVDQGFLLPLRSDLLCHFFGQEQRLLSLTPFQQSGDNASGCVVPHRKLRRSLRMMTLIQVSQQRGVGEVAGARVVDKIHQRVELVLRQSHCDEIVDGRHRPTHILQQQCAGLFLGNGELGMNVRTSMPVTDRPDTGAIPVGVQLQTFKLFGE